jgi:tRNA(Leu) C34 or U34 (ribose-2'-O)-methylase TrmL
MSLGFAAIGLFGPKCDANIGGAFRAAGCYGAALVAVQATRICRVPTDTQKSWRKLPILAVSDLFDACPFNCIPVAVDLVDGAQSLVDYVHPDRAFYVFGPEDGTLGEKILSRCRDKVMVPTVGCMNLAATVNVILYDRTAKQITRGGK